MGLLVVLGFDCTQGMGFWISSVLGEHLAVDLYTADTGRLAKVILDLLSRSVLSIFL